MENEKKPSRFGVRLSAIVVALLLVVCMAVPAFAYGVFPDNLPVPPEGEFILFVNAAGNGLMFDLDGVSYIQRDSNDVAWKFYAADGQVAYTTRYTVSSGQWKAGTSNESTVSSSFSPSWSSRYYVSNELSVTFPPPPVPPDLKQNVTAGLTVVLDWVGATVSALFSGELAGLVPLVAVPVAITLLLVAIAVIKRSIWGA